MISQSNNFMANTALEEWVRRNADEYNRRNKNVVLLSSSCGNSGRRNIKAFFLGEAIGCDQVKQEQGEQARIVFGSLPKDAVLSQLPVVTVSADDRSVMVSTTLDNPTDGDVVCTLQTIADNMITNNTATSRISLVRPDGGWFPGLQEIREDMETSLREIEAIRKDKNRMQAPKVDLTPRHNSYGSYF